MHGARHVWERRSLTLFRDRARNCVRIGVELPAEEGELVGRAIEQRGRGGRGGARRRVRERALGRELGAQQADAFVAIMKAYLGGGAGRRRGRRSERSRASAPAADHYQVVVHVDEKALRGEAGRSDLPIETVRRLACDGSVVTIVEDERGTPLDVGRKQRTVSTALRRALWSRDRGCTFPGCSRAHYVDAHHIRHWIDGGGTSLDNTHAALHASPQAAARRRVHDSSRRKRRHLFPAADGRVIPRAGYRAVDMIDDGIGARRRRISIAFPRKRG